jgi:uncharacterized protein YndB with AHSA1/START domain
VVAVVVDSIEREIVIEAPIDVVWSVITEPDHVARWFSDEAEIDLRPGGDALVTWHHEAGPFRVRIERVEPPHVFAYRWVRRPDVTPAHGNSTLVEFTLRAEGERATRLRVTESGFASLDWSEDEKAEYQAENVRGWGLELDELHTYALEVPGVARR